MSENNNENVNVHAQYFRITTDGVAYLNLDTCGTDYADMPEELRLPAQIDGHDVLSLATGMFAGNKRIKKVTLPTTINRIPDWFCRYATNLHSIDGTENIREIGKSAFYNTRIKSANFPALGAEDASDVPGTLGVGAFGGCAYLETANIGSVTTIPAQTFVNCPRLREVTGGSLVTSIGRVAFANTRSLRKLSWLNSNITMAAGAFYCSGIDTSSLVVTGGTQPNAFPKFQEAIDFWTNQQLEYTPCRNRLATKLSQNYAGWKGENFPKWNGTTYDNVHAFFAVMHIHSAITGKYYSSPSEFMEELQSDPKLAKFLLEANWPGNFKNVASMFEALGHHTEVHGNGSTLNEKNYLAVQKALEQGAYVYTEVPSLSYWMAGNYRTGHAVVLYGINHDKEVRVLDSNVLHEEFREGGLDPNIDVYTYTMPYQNMVGTGSRFVIVYPRKKEPVVRWTGHGETGRFFFHSMPNEYPANCVTTCCVEVKDDESYAPTPRNGILTAYLMGGYGYRTFVPEGETALYMQVMYRNEKGVYTWRDWVKLSPDTTAATDGDGETSA